MSAAREAGQCRRLERWLTAHVDGELDAVHALEVEDHLASCALCTEYVAVLSATRASLQRECKLRAPASLRDRVAASLASASLAAASPAAGRVVDEQSRPGESLDASALAPSPGGPLRGAAVAEPGAGRASAAPTDGAARMPQRVHLRRARADGQRGRLRFVLPLAAAATVLLLLGTAQLRERLGPSSTRGENYAASTLDGLLEDLVAQHAHPPPPETTDPDGLERFDPYIGVRVRQPSLAGARYVGARMMDQRAALLQYVVRDRHRVTMYVFDPRKVTLSTGRLAPRRVGDDEVLVGRVRGYSVAASQRHGVGYALASDLSDDESTNLLVMAAR